MNEEERGLAGADPSKEKAPLRRRLRRGIVVMTVLLVAVYGYMMATAGGHNLLDALYDLQPHLLVLPVLATLLSYVTMSLSYSGITRAAGSTIGNLDMLRITFVANTANYVLPTGGLSGFALRMVMLNKKGISAGRAVLISFTQTLLTNLMLMVFIVYGLVYLVLTRSLDPISVALVGVVITGLTAFLGACLAMVYRESMRTRFLAAVSDLTERLLHRAGRFERFGARAKRFFVHIDEGMQFFASEPRAMIGPLVWIFLDWVFTIGVLYAAFYSIGSSVSYGQVVVAFSVGIVFAVVSFVPGGVGILEVALNEMFESGGVPKAESVLAILIFRISFYVMPIILSVVLARGAFAEVEPAMTEEAL